MKYEEALLKVRMHLTSQNDQHAIEASVKLAAWILGLQEAGTKFVVVNGDHVRAFKFTAEGPVIN